MAFPIKSLTSIGVAALLCAAVQAETDIWPQSMLIVSSDDYAMSEPGNLQNAVPSIKILNLDNVSHLEERLSENLPADEVQARDEFNRRVSTIGKDQLESHLRSAYEALGAAMAYRLDRYPAIIFDEQLLVYGVTDLLVALDLYRDWKIDQREKVTHE